MRTERIVPSQLVVALLLLMEDGKLKCLRLESANPAAEVNHVDERSEDRLSFYPVPISDSTGIGFDVADDGRRMCRVVHA